MSIPDIFSECHCEDVYSYEPHGDGYAVYFGRCEHRHGYNLMNVSTHDTRILDKIVGLLNHNLDEIKDIEE